MKIWMRLLVVTCGVLLLSASVALAIQQINTEEIADGAVTDAKISGPISADKIAPGSFQKKYANVVVVAKSGGDFTNVYDALNSINDASADNPYLIQIMPGVYTQNYILYMRNHVDIKGSGVGVTRLVMNGTYNTPAMPSYSLFSFGIGSASEIGEFTVEMNASGNTCSSGMRFDPVTVWEGTPTIRNMVIHANGANFNNGFYLLPGASPTIDNLTLDIRPLAGCGSGRVIYARENSGARFTNSTLKGGSFDLPYAPATLELSNTVVEAGSPALSVGGYNSGEVVVTMIGSRISGGAIAARIQTNGVLQGANNQLAGTVENFGVLKLFNSYDQNFAPLALP